MVKVKYNDKNMKIDAEETGLKSSLGINWQKKAIL